VASTSGKANVSRATTSVMIMSSVISSTVGLLHLRPGAHGNGC
jgi:hypothetical protein